MVSIRSHLPLNWKQSVDTSPFRGPMCMSSCTCAPSVLANVMAKRTAANTMGKIHHERMTKSVIQWPRTRSTRERPAEWSHYLRRKATANELPNCQCIQWQEISNKNSALVNISGNRLMDGDSLGGRLGEAVTHLTAKSSTTCSTDCTEKTRSTNKAYPGANLLMNHIPNSITTPNVSVDRRTSASQY